MHVSALVRIDPVPPLVPAERAGAPDGCRRPHPSETLRLLLRTVRALQEQPGFLRWQTFRALDATNSLFIQTDWVSTSALHDAMEMLPLGLWAAEAELSGLEMSGVELLSPTFDRQLSTGTPAASLLRVSRCLRNHRGVAERESELALRALAAPGSSRIVGLRGRDGVSATCRIDFDTEDGIWHFLDSRLRDAWSSWARKDLETETWAINLPRLEFHGTPVTRVTPRPAPAELAGLSVQITTSDDAQTAHLRLEGRLDRESAGRCERICRSVLASGCRRLEVDVSELVELRREVLEILTAAARELKQRGGQFVLIDNEERVRRITRTKHLQSSVR